MSNALPVLDRRALKPQERAVVWVPNTTQCFACLAPATQEIQDRSGWLPVCDDPACHGVDE